MPRQDDARTFVQRAERSRNGLIREMWEWIRHNKKWWLTPIVLLLMIVGALVILSGTAVAPFIYTLF